MFLHSYCTNINKHFTISLIRYINEVGKLPRTSTFFSERKRKLLNRHLAEKVFISCLILHIPTVVDKVIIITKMFT